MCGSTVVWVSGLILGVLCYVVLLGGPRPWCLSPCNTTTLTAPTSVETRGTPPPSGPANISNQRSAMDARVAGGGGVRGRWAAYPGFEASQVCAEREPRSRVAGTSNAHERVNSAIADGSPTSDQQAPPRMCTRAYACTCRCAHACSGSRWAAFRRKLADSRWVS